MADEFATATLTTPSAPGGGGGGGATPHNLTLSAAMSSDGTTALFTCSYDGVAQYWELRYGTTNVGAESILASGESAPPANFHSEEIGTGLLAWATAYHFVLMVHFADE